VTHDQPPRKLLIVLCVGAFLAGLVVRGFTASSSARTVGHAAANPIGGNERSLAPGPAKYRDGIPSGFAQTKDGARAAAVAYVLTGQTLMNLAPTLVDDAVRSMSAAGSADTQVSTAEDQLDRVRQVLAAGTGPTNYQQAVLATRVDAFTPDRARVSVWHVGVLSRAGVAAPQAGWNTSVFDLVWEQSDWKVWGETITPGPAPALNASATPATSDQLNAALNGYTPWESAP
jgi:hypothetical protein